MSVIILLILFSILIAGGFLIAFLWAVKSGQLDDKYTPSVRILFDDTTETKDIKENNKPDNNVSK
jgi:cbb3-type cytochrome oxidase maturation protein